MTYRIFAWLAEPASNLLYSLSAAFATISGGFVWIWAQAGNATASTNLIGGGAIIAGLVAIVTACSPLFLGALDRKSLRKSLRAKIAERDYYKADSARLRQYIVNESIAGKAKLPDWFHRPPSKPTDGTGDFEMIPAPKDANDTEDDEP